MLERKCAGCGRIKNRDELIKITRTVGQNEIIINHDNKKFGRSVYLCYDNQCIEAAFKKNKLKKVLKASVPDDLKGQLLNELRHSKSK